MQHINKNNSLAITRELDNLEVQIQKVEEISKMLSVGKRRISFQRMQMIGHAETLLLQIEEYEERLSMALDEIHQALAYLYH